MQTAVPGVIQCLEVPNYPNTQYVYNVWVRRVANEIDHKKYKAEILKQLLQANNATVDLYGEVTIE